MSARLTLLYFASLRDAAGMAQAIVDTGAMRLSDVYIEQAHAHGFALPIEQVRVAVDGAFADWADRPRDGSEVAFIPPVSGG